MELPYPMPSIGTTYVDHLEFLQDKLEKRGIDEKHIIRVPGEYMNPFAVGHFINHPPPDIPANVKTVDLDLPYTFFPSYMTKYLPYLNCGDNQVNKT